MPENRTISVNKSRIPFEEMQFSDLLDAFDQKYARANIPTEQNPNCEIKDQVITLELHFNVKE